MDTLLYLLMKWFNWSVYSVQSVSEQQHRWGLGRNTQSQQREELCCRHWWNHDGPVSTMEGGEFERWSSIPTQDFAACPRQFTRSWWLTWHMNVSLTLSSHTAAQNSNIIFNLV